MSEVIYYTSDEAGAPVLIGPTPGTLIGVLDACLVNGFNSKTVASITVAGGVATVTCSAHGYKAGRKVLQAGATTLTGLNGIKLVLTTPTANTYTFDATGVANGTENTGLSAKRPPLGWIKQFADTNRAMYARTDVNATAMMLRVDDTSTQGGSVRVMSVETASDLDTYTGPSPSAAAFPGGQFWHRGMDNGGPQNWILIGDGRTFYFLPVGRNSPDGVNDGYYGTDSHAFGDLASFRAADAYACMIGGNQSNGTASTGIFSASPTSNAEFTSGFLCQRGYSQIGAAIGLYIPGGASSGSIVLGGGRPLFPSPIDNGMVVGDRVLVGEANAALLHPFRGYLRGVKEPMAQLPDSAHWGVFGNVYGSNRSLVAVRIITPHGLGSVLFDITGPWD